MLSIIKRILRLSGKYRFRVIAGLIFNALKSCCAAFVFFAVLLVMLNIEHLTSAVIWQAFGIIALSVLSVSQMHNRRLRPLNLSTIQIERKKFICHSTVFFQIKDLSFSHKSMPELLHNISLEACKGETIALIGENGCGKTTLGKVLSGLIRCRRGAFSIDGQTVKQRKLADYVYFVMQEADHQLYTDSVAEELRLGNKKIQDIDEKIDSVLKMLHLENFKNCHPYALSGGQKQRLTIGAAMLSEKPILVLDEPTSGLDWDNMCAVANAVNYMRETGKLVFIITHDLEFISLTATRVLYVFNIFYGGLFRGCAGASETKGVCPLCRCIRVFRGYKALCKQSCKRTF